MRSRAAGRPALSSAARTVDRLDERANGGCPRRTGRSLGCRGRAGARTWVGGPGEVGGGVASPSTPTRAITPRPEGKPGMVAGSRAGYAGHLNVVDLRGHVALRPRRDRATPGRRDGPPGPLVRTDASKPGSRSAPPPSADPLAELTGLLVLTQCGQPDGEVVGRAQGVGVVLAQDAAVAGQGVLA